MFCCCFKNIFHDFCHTDYLNICGTDFTIFAGLVELWPIEIKSEVIFRSLKGRCRATIFVDKIDLQYTPCSSRDIR